MSEFTTHVAVKTIFSNDFLSARGIVCGELVPCSLWYACASFEMHVPLMFSEVSDGRREANLLSELQLVEINLTV